MFVFLPTCQIPIVLQLISQLSQASTNYHCALRYRTAFCKKRWHWQGYRWYSLCSAWSDNQARRYQARRCCDRRHNRLAAYKGTKGTRLAAYQFREILLYKGTLQVLAFIIISFIVPGICVYRCPGLVVLLHVSFPSNLSLLHEHQDEVPHLRGPQCPRDWGLSWRSPLHGILVPQGALRLWRWTHQRFAFNWIQLALWTVHQRIQFGQRYTRAFR